MDLPNATHQPPSPSSGFAPEEPSRNADASRRKSLTFPLAMAFLSLPLLGAISIALLALLLDPPVEPYAEVSERVQQLDWRDRFVLAQMYLAHADGIGVGPVEGHSCAREIADGDDLSLCMPARADRIQMSVLLLERMVAAMGAQGGTRFPANDSEEWVQDSPYPFEAGETGEEEYGFPEEGDDCPYGGDPEWQPEPGATRRGAPVEI